MIYSSFYKFWHFESQIEKGKRSTRGKPSRHDVKWHLLLVNSDFFFFLCLFLFFTWLLMNEWSKFQMRLTQFLIEIKECRCFNTSVSSFKFDHFGFFSSEPIECNFLNEACLCESISYLDFIFELCFGWND